MPYLTMLWRTQADQATCFEIYKYQDSYIIHGEFEISRLDKNGKILWQQSGADIFTTLNSKDSFEITDNYIIATDWENRKYKFDYEGTDWSENHNLKDALKNSFKKACKFYIILLSILTVAFWLYMIYDDWIFVEKYGISLEGVWNWFLWYLGYCFITFSIYYWTLTTIGILIYHKVKKNWL